MFQLAAQVTLFRQKTCIWFLCQQAIWFLNLSNKHKRNAPLLHHTSTIYTSSNIPKANLRPLFKTSIFNLSLHHGMPYLSHFDARYEQYINQYLIYRHRVNCCINCVFVFQLFMIILLVVCTCVILIGIPNNKKYLKASIKKCLFFMKINSSLSVLAQFYPKNAMNNPPPFYSIEYSGSCRPFLFRKLQLIKKVIIIVLL